MSDSIKLITTGPMLAASHLSGWTSTGYNNYDVLDNNPDKYWQTPASPTADNFNIDLSEAKACAALVLFINNYSTDFTYATGGYRIGCYSDDDNSGYENTVFVNETLANETTTPIWYKEFTSATYRYWRVRYDALNTSAPTLKIGGVWLGRVWTLQANEYPEDDHLIYGNRAVESLSGHPFRTAYRTLGVRTIPRTFHFPDATNFGYLKSAYEDSRGSLLPFILIEGDDDTTASLCYFSDEGLRYNKINSGIYQPTVTIQQLPYIPDGENY